MVNPSNGGDTGTQGEMAASGANANASDPVADSAALAELQLLNTPILGDPTCKALEAAHKVTLAE